MNNIFKKSEKRATEDIMVHFKEGDMTGMISNKMQSSTKLGQTATQTISAPERTWLERFRTFGVLKEHKKSWKATMIRWQVSWQLQMKKP